MILSSASAKHSKVKVKLQDDTPLQGPNRRYPNPHGGPAHPRGKVKLRETSSYGLCLRVTSVAVPTLICYLSGVADGLIGCCVAFVVTTSNPAL